MGGESRWWVCRYFTISPLAAANRPSCCLNAFFSRLACTLWLLVWQTFVSPSHYVPTVETTDTTKYAKVAEPKKKKRKQAKKSEALLNWVRREVDHRTNRFHLQGRPASRDICVSGLGLDLATWTLPGSRVLAQLLFIEHWDSPRKSQNAGWNLQKWGMQGICWFARSVWGNWDGECGHACS